MKKLLLLLTLLTLPVFAGSFTNGGFETGDWTGWTQGSGWWHGGWPMDPASYLPGGSKDTYPSGWQGIITDPGPDPILGNLLNQVYNGSHSARINNTVNDYSVGVIAQSVTGYTDPKMYFEWAAVLEASHGLTDSDNFTLKLHDDTDNTDVLLRSYSSASAPGIFNHTYAAYRDWYWSGWNVEEIDVAGLGLTGHDFTLSLLASDCPYGGHAGYVYLDGFAPTIIPPGIPEPGTIGLFGTVLAGLLIRKFRKH